MLTHAAGYQDDKEVAQTQSYGPEARGGASRSDVVISDQKIDYTKTISLDAFVTMSQLAFDTYKNRIVQDKTKVIADTSLVTDIPAGMKIYKIEATRLADEEFGRTLFANIIMLGALSAITGIIALSSLEKTLEGNVPPKTLETNRKALARGFELGKNALEES